MNKSIPSLILIVILLLSFSQAVNAQSPVPQLISGTKPISVEARSAIETYLVSHLPSNANYYAPTYYLDNGLYQFVSLAGLNLNSVDEVWSLEARDDEPLKVIWVGTLKIFMNGSVELYSSASSLSMGGGHLASLNPSFVPRNLAAGGSTVIQFPFDHSAMYGPRGMHGSGDYGTSGMVAVDLVGGASMGSNVMSDSIYASDTGTVDYVCDDGTSVAIRTHNASTGDYFVYAHLLNNASLQMGHTFSRGAKIGSLKHGSFTGDCGWADQSPDVYHVHWMFTPADGAFRIGTYTFTTSDGNFHAGSMTIGPGDWLIGAHTTGNGGDDPSGNANPISFWDNPVNAIVSFVGWITGMLPENNDLGGLVQSIIAGVGMAFRLLYVFAKGNIKLAPAMALILIVIGIKIIMGAVWVIVFIYRAIYNMIPGAA